MDGVRVGAQPVAQVRRLVHGEGAGLGSAGSGDGEGLAASGPCSATRAVGSILTAARLNARTFSRPICASTWSTASSYRRRALVAHWSCAASHRSASS